MVGTNPTLAVRSNERLIDLTDAIVLCSASPPPRPATDTAALIVYVSTLLSCSCYPGTEFVVTVATNNGTAICVG